MSRSVEEILSRLRSVIWNSGWNSPSDQAMVDAEEKLNQHYLNLALSALPEVRAWNVLQEDGTYKEENNVQYNYAIKDMQAQLHKQFGGE